MNTVADPAAEWIELVRRGALVATHNAGLALAREIADLETELALTEAEEGVVARRQLIEAEIAALRSQCTAAEQRAATLEAESLQRATDAAETAVAQCRALLQRTQAERDRALLTEINAWLLLDSDSLSPIELSAAVRAHDEPHRVRQQLQRELAEAAKAIAGLEAEVQRAEQLRQASAELEADVANLRRRLMVDHQMDAQVIEAWLQMPPQTSTRALNDYVDVWAGDATHEAQWRLAVDPLQEVRSGHPRR